VKTIKDSFSKSQSFRNRSRPDLSPSGNAFDPTADATTGNPKSPFVVIEPVNKVEMVEMSSQTIIQTTEKSL